MAEVFGIIINYVCQISIILYVLKEFGFIKIGNMLNNEQVTTNADGAKSAAPPAMDFGGLLGGIMENMSQQLSKSQQPAAPTNNGVQIEAVE